MPDRLGCRTPGRHALGVARHAGRAWPVDRGPPRRPFRRRRRHRDVRREV